MSAADRKRRLEHGAATHLVDGIPFRLAVVHLAVPDVLVEGTVRECDADEGGAASGPSLALLVVVDLQVQGEARQ